MFCFLQAVEVFVCRVKPIDRDTEWTNKVCHLSYMAKLRRLCTVLAKLIVGVKVLLEVEILSTINRVRR